MRATKEIRHPATRYYGGKWLLASWVISFMPHHRHYIELFCGACSVLLQKPRSQIETVNDLDSNVVNYFRVLRDQSEELIHKINLSPWSREEYNLHREPCNDPVEKARRFWVGAMQSIGCLAYTTSGWRAARARAPGKVCAMTNLTADHLYAVARRLKGVQIEKRPYQDIIERYDAPGHLFYADPPYLKSTRSHPDEYHIDWSEEDHIEAAALFRKCKSYIILSGYQSELYKELYEDCGWRYADKKAQTNAGGTRIERLFLSPNLPLMRQAEMV